MCLLVTQANSKAWGESVCFEEKHAVDLITLLDASARDIELLSTCEKLVSDLYKEIEAKDKKIVSLTDEVIKANQRAIKYERKYKAARNVAWYSVIGSIIVVIIKIAPAL